MIYSSVVKHSSYTIEYATLFFSKKKRMVQHTCRQEHPLGYLKIYRIYPFPQCLKECHRQVTYSGCHVFLSKIAFWLKIQNHASYIHQLSRLSETKPPLAKLTYFSISFRINKALSEESQDQQVTSSRNFPFVIMIQNSIFMP